MQERQSNSDENLFLLDDAEAFQKHVQRVAEGARRELVILSEFLDPLVYDQPAFSSAVSALARRDRNSRIRILVKDIRPLLERGHGLLRLARRLSSKVEIRKLLIEPEDDAQAFLIADREALVYKHDDRNYQGFAQYRGGPEAKPLLENFDHLWEQHGEASPSLRRLHL